MENTHHYWIIVGSPQVFETTRSLNFTMIGLKSRHRKKAERMQPGDRIAWYVTGRKAFAGTATITSTYVEDHSLVWKSSDPKRELEDYPFRLEINPDTVLDDDHFVEAEPVARELTYVQKWPAKNWTLAFQGNVHEIDAADFSKIEAAVDAAAKVNA